MPPSHLLASALVVGTIMSGCSSDNGPDVAQGTISWTDNGTQHSLTAPHAGLFVINEGSGTPLRSFRTFTAVDAGAVLQISINMHRRFTTGDYRCEPQQGTDGAEIFYGLSMETNPPALQDCLVTIHQIGIKYSGIADYTVGTFSGTIVVGDELHELTDGSFSAQTGGLSQNTD